MQFMCIYFFIFTILECNIEFSRLAVAINEFEVRSRDVAFFAVFNLFDFAPPVDIPHAHVNYLSSPNSGKELQ